MSIRRLPHQTRALLIAVLVTIVGCGAAFAGETVAQTSVAAAASRHRPAPRPEPPLPPEVVEQIDALAETTLSRGLPGMAVGVRTSDGSLFARGYGFADVEAGRPVRADDVFQVGSITKQFTAALIMRLVERGLVDLDDSIADYVPELDTRGYRVTIHDLLTHTSGVPNYTDYVDDLYTSLTQEEVIALVNAKMWLFRPGAAWSYSNTGYYLAGMVLERVTGTPFVEMLTNEIILPLGLTRTSYCGTMPGQSSAEGYIRSPGVPTQKTPPWDPDLGWAAGALCSTVGDLILWTRALAGGSVVSAESWEAMTTKVRLENGLEADYGYGLAIATHEGRRLIAHGGAVPGFLSFLAWYPDSDLAVVVLTNLYSGIDYASSTAVKVGDAVLDALQPAVERAVPAGEPFRVPSGPLTPRPPAGTPDPKEPY